VNTSISRDLADLPTPALLLDQDVLERNLRHMQTRADTLGVQLRPHIKTHKCIEIGRRQTELGARGVTVSTLEEARVFAEHGFEDITWAFPVILSRIDEALSLAERVRLGLTVDSAEAIDALQATGRPVRVWLKVDCGYGRAGVDPQSERALALADRVYRSSSLDLAGFLTHSGHAYHGESPESIAAIAEQERDVMVAFGDRVRGHGIEPGQLSVGSTPALARVRSLEGIAEVRPGNYALHDYTQLKLGTCQLEDCALTVLASVVSSDPKRERCVTDAGALALSKDLGPADHPRHFGRILAELDANKLDPEATMVSVSQEHGVLGAARTVGTKVRILANHSCLTVAQFDSFTVVRGRKVRDSWKIWRSRGPAG
jgi:D-serine deaminase-like pyridoxal phosphate-dependent protein